MSKATHATAMATMQADLLALRGVVVGRLGRIAADAREESESHESLWEVPRNDWDRISVLASGAEDNICALLESLEGALRQTRAGLLGRDI